MDLYWLASLYADFQMVAVQGVEAYLSQTTTLNTYSFFLGMQIYPVVQ